MKRIAVFLFLIFIFLCSCLPVYASLAPEYSDLLEGSGASELADELPKETREQLEESGISIESTEIDISRIIESILKSAKKESSQPLKTGAVLLGAVVLAALAGGFKNALSSSPAAETVNCAVSVFCAVTVITPVMRYFSTAEKAIAAANGFEKCFIPVFAAVLVSAGQTAGAAGSAAGILTASELSSSILSGVILPFSKVLAGVSACSCAIGGGVDSLIKGMEKCVKWILGFLSSVLVGALTISGIVSSGVDTVAGKTMKFVVSGTVPVIGGSLSEALTSVKSCIGLLKNSVGAFGIVACAYIFLPSVIQGAAWVTVLSLCAGASEMLCAESTAKVLRAFSGIVSLVLSACILMMLVLIISAAVIVIVGKGTN